MLIVLILFKVRQHLFKYEDLRLSFVALLKCFIHLLLSGFFSVLVPLQFEIVGFRHTQQFLVQTEISCQIFDLVLQLFVFFSIIV